MACWLGEGTRALGRRSWETAFAGLDRPVAFSVADKSPLLGVRYFSRANFNFVERSFEPPAPALNKLRPERGGRL